MSAFALYQGPRALLYQCVWIPAVASAVLLVALPIADRVTANDFSIGLLLKSIEIFAFGLGTLASLLLPLLLVFPDVAKQIKMRAFTAVLLPYAVLAVLWLILKTAHA